MAQAGHCIRVCRPVDLSQVDFWEAPTASITPAGLSQVDFWTSGGHAALPAALTQWTPRCRRGR